MKNNNKNTHFGEHSPIFTLTVITSDNGNMNKVYTRNDKTVVKKSSANLSRGTYEVKELYSVAELDTFLDTLQSNQAMTIGTPHKNGKFTQSGRIVSKSIEDKGAINRTKEHFKFSDAFLIDIDESVLKIEEIIPALIKIDPNLAHASILVRASSSFGVHIKSSELVSDETTSYHVWVGGVLNGNDIPRYGKTFAKRCWLLNLGAYIKISKRGSLLVRQLIDDSVFSPERLVFEAKSTLGDGLVQAKVPSIIQEGFSLDTTKLLDLNNSEQQYYDFLEEQKKQFVQKEADQVKKAHIEATVVKAVDNGQSESLARNQAEASLLTNTLYPSQVLNFTKCGLTIIADVLADPNKYDGETLADPLNTDIHARTDVAKLYVNDNGIVINSFSEGGRTFTLQSQQAEPNSDIDLEQSITQAIAQESLTVKNSATWLASTIVERKVPSTAEDFLITSVIKKLNLGNVKTSLKKQVKTSVLQLKQKAHNACDRKVVNIQNDLNQPLDPLDFPDVTHQKDRLIIKSTISNLTALMKGYGIDWHYNIISKEQSLVVANDAVFCADIADNAKLARIKSQCNLNNVTEKATEHLSYLFATKPINPVIDYISPLEWDGKDHIKALTDVVIVAKHSEDLWVQSCRKWLIQCVSAADYAEKSPNPSKISKFELCLIFSGKQGIYKTTFFNSIIPKELKKYFADGIRLDPNNKDSVKSGISTWISEIGEIDSTFNKSAISDLKAFFSKQVDTIRLPYDRLPSAYQRRTSFCGSVNNTKFLNDKTGNRRFIPIEVESLPAVLPVDIDQLWAQVWALYLGGEQWWADDEMTALLDDASTTHAKDSAVRESLISEFDLNKSGDSGEQHTVKAIREKLDLPNSNAVITEIRQVLEGEFKIQKKTIRGTNGYRLLARSLSN